jgi:HEAT repeat protein
MMNKAQNALVLLNTAIKNIRLYPPSSTIVTASVDRLHQTFIDMLQIQSPIVFSESDRNILVDGNPLDYKDQEKIHVMALKDIMLTFGIKSITFETGATREEFSLLVSILSKKSEDFQAEGGFLQALAGLDIPHIRMDEKVYVAMDKDQANLQGLTVSGDEIARFFLLTHPGIDVHSQDFRELAGNTEALRKAFEAGLSNIMAQKETLTSAELLINLNSMLVMLDKISGGLDDDNRGILSKQVGSALLSADPSMALQLTTQNMEHLLGGLLLQYLMTELAQDQNTVPESTAEDPQSKLRKVADKFSLRLQDPRTFLDSELMSVLPKIIEQLIAQKEREALETVLIRLTQKLESPDTDVRNAAARGLAGVIEGLSGEQKKTIVEKVADKLTAWLKSESHFSSEYTRICRILKDAAHDDIVQQRFNDALPYLDTFDQIASGTVSQGDDARLAARDMINHLATEDNIKAIWTQYESGDEKKKTEVKTVLALLGEEPLNYLLDLLHTRKNSNERVSIMHMIMNASKKALPLIGQRLRHEEPWYYLRNLTYMLGQIGNEESAGLLQPFLHHKNEKLRQETLKAIQKTGGARRGKLLLSALNNPDDEFRQTVVEALGASRAEDAVAGLLKILKDRPLIASAGRIALEETICTALGVIGSPDAIPLLSEIAETKSFLGLRSYPDRVKSVAAGSLVTLRRKVAQSAET